MNAVWVVIVSAVIGFATTHARADAPTFQFDNDLFSGRGRDEDYSWGITASFRRTESSAWQAGIIAMTPRDVAASEALQSERPYASLLYLSRAQMRVAADHRSARYISVTVGALGLEVADALQSSVHHALSDDPPNGWDHQISAGGELTARALLAQQWLVNEAATARGTSQWKVTLSASAGYLTEATAALSWRGGRFTSEWWTQAPELTDYAPAPLPVSAGVHNQSGWYAFGGMRLKARAYNSLLQGQFKHSDVTVADSDVAPLLLEGWIGVARCWDTLRMTYTLRAISREVAHGPGARNLIWGGLAVEKAF